MKTALPETNSNIAPENQSIVGSRCNSFLGPGLLSGYQEQTVSFREIRWFGKPLN